MGRLDSDRGRRIRRFAFTLVAGVSLLVCVAALGSSVTSFFTGFYFDARHSAIGDSPNEVNRYSRRLMASRGHVAFQWTRLRVTYVDSAKAMADLGDDDVEFTTFPPKEPNYKNAYLMTNFVVAKYAERASSTPMPGYERVLVVPGFLIAAITAVLPAIWFVTTRRRRIRRSRLRAGRCVACGYDLRESRDRCPECGAAASVDAAQRPGAAPPADASNALQPNGLSR